MLVLTFMVVMVMMMLVFMTVSVFWICHASALNTPKDSITPTMATDNCFDTTIPLIDITITILVSICLPHVSCSLRSITSRSELMNNYQHDVKAVISRKTYVIAIKKAARFSTGGSCIQCACITQLAQIVGNSQTGRSYSCPSHRHQLRKRCCLRQVHGALSLSSTMEQKLPRTQE